MSQRLGESEKKNDEKIDLEEKDPEGFPKEELEEARKRSEVEKAMKAKAKASKEATGKKRGSKDAKKKEKKEKKEKGPKNDKKWGLGCSVDVERRGMPRRCFSSGCCFFREFTWTCQRPVCPALGVFSSWPHGHARGLFVTPCRPVCHTMGVVFS